MNKILYLLVFLTFDAIAIDYQAELACVLHLDEKCIADIATYKSYDKLSVFAQQPDKAVGILNRYYQTAKKNDLSVMVDIFSNEDGSRQLIKEKIRKTPTMFSRFHKLKDVEILSSARLGDYYSYKVRWIDAKGEVLANWLELVHCPDQCYMSARVLDQTDESYFYAIATSFSPGGQGVIADVNTVKINIPKKSNYAVSVNINTVVTEDKNALLNLSEFLSHLKQEYENIVGVEGSNWDKKYQQFINIYSTYWSGIESSTRFQLPELDGNTVSFPLRNIYSHSAKMAGIQSVSSPFFIQGDGVDFYFLELTFPEGTQYLLLAVDESGSLIPMISVKGKNAELLELLYHPFVYLKLIEKAQSKDSAVQIKLDQKIEPKKNMLKESLPLDASAGEPPSLGVQNWIWALFIGFSLLIVLSFVLYKMKK